MDHPEINAICKQICVKVNAMRKERGITLEALSQSAGIPLQTLRTIDQEEAIDLAVEELHAICVCFGVSLRDYFREL